MPDIRGIVNEFQQLKIEIDMRSKEMRKLRKRKKELEKEISIFIKDKNQPGLKHRDIAIIPEGKPKRLYKKKEERENDGKYILEKYGISDSRRVLNELLEAMKGDPVESDKIKIKKL